MSNAQKHKILVPKFENMIHLLRNRAESDGANLAYNFLEDGDERESRINYAELDRRARAVGSYLQERGENGGHGTRVLLIFHSSIEYIYSFFGCLYAGAIAVTAYPPRVHKNVHDRNLQRLIPISRDSGATFAFTTSEILSRIAPLFPELPELAALNWVAVDELPSELSNDWRQPTVASDEIAFLQYTSGSTGVPKGVMVSHYNLLHNQEVMEAGWPTGPQHVYAGWLPIFHDLGLIGLVIRAMYVGAPYHFMQPPSFIQKPLRWLKAISKYKATLSMAPNFAYELCMEKISEADRATLDLSSWEMALNGAEPVREHTIRRFADVFRDCGFRATTMNPHYGLAEATLVVTGHKTTPARIEDYDIEALEAGVGKPAALDAPIETRRAQVSSGEVLGDQRVAIVDPETLKECPEGKIGELWLNGGSVARGYWQRPKETAETFQARISDTGEGPFLRTGDLAFIRNGHVFISSRLKDLIIIRGANHYPQDIELTCESADPALRPANSAAFAIEVDGEERLVVVQEVERTKRKGDFTDVFAAIRQAIAEKHDVSVYAIALISPGSIPKTTSGKIQRRGTKQAFLDGELNLIAEWRESDDPQAAARTPASAPAAASEREPVPAPPSHVSQAHPERDKSAGHKQIESWLVEYLSRKLGLAQDRIDRRRPLSSYGLNSALSVGLSGDIGEWLGRSVAATLVYEYPTIEAIALFLDSPEESEKIEARRSSERESAPADRGASRSEEPIAIVGLGCRFPGARDVSEFWDLLKGNKDAIRLVPSDRPGWKDIAESELSNVNGVDVRIGGFLEQVEEFDAEFFGISPREADAMDPQQRLTLEVAYECLEDAGIPLERIRGTQTGVFIGVSTTDYHRYQFQDLSTLNLYAGTGIAHSIVANRLSYLFDLRGPSLAVDTACSSSLYAIHYAVQSLRSGESEFALAGGVNLILSPDFSVAFARSGLLSRDNRCKTFDESANGYVRSEGCGIVALKRLSAALKDNDRIYAVIHGVSVNQDGRSNGLTAPSVGAQEELLREAVVRAGIRPSQVSYVEAHGTGTELGDPIEARAIERVLGENREPGLRCAIGSVKSNIGHLEAAAGVAGLIKATLALYHSEIPANLHFNALNKHISIDPNRFLIPTTNLPWAGWRDARYAGVSSFGFGGANAHVIIGDNPETVWQSSSRRQLDGKESPLLLTVSAQSEVSLRKLTANYGARLKTAGPAEAQLICAGAALRRSRFDLRASFAADSGDELSRMLADFSRGELTDGSHSDFAATGKKQRIAFVCSGQGPRFWSFSRELFDANPTFHSTLAECDSIMRRIGGWSICDQLFARPEDSLLGSARYTQPALAALQIAIGETWKSLGVHPDVVLGHSMGEVSAACIAGGLSIEDAMLVIHHRGELIQKVAGQGKMAFIDLPRAEVERIIAPYTSVLSIAAVNSPGDVVISGDPAAIDKVLAQLTAKEVFARVLESVDFASHSPYMDSVKSAMQKALVGLKPRQAKSEFYSTYLLANVQGHKLNADYWANNVREPVYFAPAIQALNDQGVDLFLEIGPHPALSQSIVKTLQGSANARTFHSLHRDRPQRRELLATLGGLYCSGLPVDFSRVYSGPTSAARLPLYPWNRSKFWIGGSPARTQGRANVGAISGGHPVLAETIGPALRDGEHYSQGVISMQELPELANHQALGRPVFPGVLYLELAMAAARQAGLYDFSIEDARFLEALVLNPERATKFQIALQRSASDSYEFTCWSQADATKTWTVHATGRLKPAVHQLNGATLNIADIADRRREKIRSEDHYREMGSKLGLDYSGTFAAINQIYRTPGVEAMSEVLSLEAQGGWTILPPGLFDSCLQVLLSAALNHIEEGASYLPTRIDRMEINARPPGERYYSYAKIQKPDAASRELIGEIHIADASGVVFGRFEGVRLSPVSGAMQSRSLDAFLHSVHLVEIQRDSGQNRKQSGACLVILDAAADSRKTEKNLRDAGFSSVQIIKCGTSATADSVALSDFGVSGGVLDNAIRESSPAHIVYAPGLSSTYEWSNERDAAEVETLAEGLCLGLAGVVTALASRLDPARVKLTVAVRSAYKGPGDALVNPIQAALCGMTRAIANERAEIEVSIVDSLAPDLDAMSTAFDLLSREDEVIVRSKACFVPRIQRGIGAAPLIRPDARKLHIISGGAGALGLHALRFLIDQGASKVCLIGRSSASPELQAALEEFQRAGSEIIYVQGDIAEPAVSARISEILASGRYELGGVIHAAGVLDDGLVETMTAERFARVMRPKVQGAMQLAKLYEKNKPDFVWYYSSLASAIGSPGQSNYAAANTFLDAMAELHIAAGIRAQSINWGPWSEIGLAAADKKRGARLSEIGIGGVSPSIAYSVLERLLSSADSTPVVVKLDFSAWSARYPQAMRQSRFGLYRPNDAHSKETKSGEGAHSNPALPPSAVPAGADGSIVGSTAEIVRAELGAVLRQEPKSIDSRKPFRAMGLDSLMAIEFRNRLQARLKVQLSATMVFNFPDLRSLTEHVAQKLESSASIVTGTTGPAASATAPRQPEAFDEDRRSGELAQMTDQEAEALLLKELERFE